MTTQMHKVGLYLEGSNGSKKRDAKRLVFGPGWRMVYSVDTHEVRLIDPKNPRKRIIWTFDGISSDQVSVPFLSAPQFRKIALMFGSLFGLTCKLEKMPTGKGKKDMASEFWFVFSKISSS